MALIGRIAIAISTNIGPLTKGLANASRQLKAFGVGISSTELLIGGLGITAAAAFAKIVMASSRLEEQTDRTKDEFGILANKVIDFSKTYGTAFGTIRKDTLETASVLSAMFEQAGYKGRQVMEMSVHFVRVIGDLSRYANVSNEQAIEDMKSALAGHPITMLKYGVNLKQENLRAFALRKKIIDSDRGLTESEKMRSVVGLIDERTQKMWGNLAKTGDKVAGAIEAVKGRFENLMAVMGESMQGGAARGLMELQLNIQAIETAWVKAGKASVDSSDITISSIAAQIFSIEGLRTAIGFIGNVWQGIQEIFLAGQLQMTLSMQNLSTAIGAIVRAMEKLKVAMGMPGTEVGNFFTQLDQELMAITKKQKDELWKMAMAPPASDQYRQGLDQAKKDIDEARKKIENIGKLDVNAIRPFGENALADKDKKQPDLSAMLYGSEKAATSILYSAFGNSTKGPAEQTAQNTAITNQILRQINAAVAAGGGQVWGAVF